MYRLCAAIFVLALAAPATGSPAGPEGGAAVLEVDSLAGVTGFFNLGQGAVRIVALVSPTSPECVAGLDSIGALLSRFPSRRLRTYVVFMPMLDSDTRISALVRVGELTDRRVVFFWNQNRSVGDAFGPLISFDGPRGTRTSSTTLTQPSGSIIRVSRTC